MIRIATRKPKTSADLSAASASLREITHLAEAQRPHRGSCFGEYANVACSGSVQIKQKEICMKKWIVAAFACLALFVNGANSQDREKNGAREAREGRDAAANARDRGDVKGAEKAADRAERGAREAAGNKDAQKDAKEARDAAKEAKDKHGKP
jgi:hypothetical protein